MASSSKVLFHLDQLQAKALESIDYRIQHAELEMAGLEDTTEHQHQVDAWRSNQYERIAALLVAAEEGRLPDQELVDFRVPPFPEISFRYQQKVISHLRELRAVRSQVLAKAGSLVADKEGNIALTKTQLREFFAL